MEKREYNGWTNYETWLAHLWMTNDGDEDVFYDAEEIFKSAEADEHFTKRENAVFALAENFKESHEEIASEYIGTNYGFFVDLINAGLSEVNWHEIAKHYIDEIEDTEEDTN